MNSTIFFFFKFLALFSLALVLFLNCYDLSKHRFLSRILEIMHVSEQFSCKLLKICLHFRAHADYPFSHPPLLPYCFL